MHQLSSSLGNIIVLSSKPQDFFSYKNEDLIKTEVYHLKEKVQQLHKGDNRPDQDPIIKYATKNLKEDLHKSLVYFSRGDKYTSRHILNRVSNNCFACHSRTNFGRKNLNIPWGINTNNTSKEELAHYYFALREYNKAIDLVIQHYTQPKVKYSKRWEEALYKALSVAVRVEQSPDLGLKITTTLQKNSQQPLFLKKYLKQWTQSLALWKKEKKPKTLSHHQKFKLAKKLYMKSSRTSDPISAFIETLRASRLLHDIVRSQWNHELYGYTLFYSGVIAKRLRFTDIGGLEQAYFESCIQRYPHTRLASNCFGYIEELMTEPEYLNSDGELLPEAQAQLDHLWSLANIDTDQPREEIEDEIWDNIQLYNNIEIRDTTNKSAPRSFR